VRSVVADSPVIVLMGPTASGKTRLAIELAHALNGEVISVDSALVYRGMDIGTAKPSLSEREGIPHHLIDILDPSEAYSTGRFKDDALKCIEEITRRGRLPILAGGTFLYFNALLKGLAELPAADQAVRGAIEAEAAEQGWDRLHAELARVDPAAARRIHPNDPQRIQRALEVYRLTGISLSELCAIQPTPLPYRFCKLALAPTNRDELRSRIRRRFLEMLDQGLIDEVRTLRDLGSLHPDLPSMRSVGYRQVWAYLEGECTEEEMIELGTIATRQFAKRQMTWLRKETEAFQLETEDRLLKQKALQRVAEFLAASESANPTEPT
jgi:tRNA dimethylallyltransferase